MEIDADEVESDADEALVLVMIGETDVVFWDDEDNEAGLVLDSGRVVLSLEPVEV